MVDTVLGRGRRRRRTRREQWLDSARQAWASARERAAPLVRPLRPVTDYVSALGFLVLAAMIGCAVLAVTLHWGEVAVAGYLLVAVFVLCVVLTFGRTELHVALALAPSRVRAGETASGRIDVLNLRRRRLLPLFLELPVGGGTGRFNLPSLAGGGLYQETFTVPTTRRGVIPIGPATTVRGDPLGLLRRVVRWTERIELFVHPHLVRLDPLDSGLLRDLEGRTTNDVSVSDLAFHALRDYVPGDDRRFIHWRSSARASAGQSTPTFLIRQFLDTRRSHLCVVVDAHDLSYADPDDFELALSAAASVATRAIRDEIKTTVVLGDQVVHEGTGERTLDAFARANPRRTPVAALAADAVRVAPATSIALIVTGSDSDFADIRRATAHFSVDVATVVLRIDPDQPVGVTTVFGITLLTIATLSDLPRLLAAGVVR